jgi:hypothetical protein
VNTRQRIHVLLGDIVAKATPTTGPVDLLEQAVLALVDCIEILADDVDVMRNRLEAPVLSPPAAPAEPDRLPTELADLQQRVESLRKTVKKLSKKK